MARERTVEVGWTDPVSEDEFLVKCKVTAGSAGVMNLPNGDPGYPPEPAEVELLSVRDDAPKGQESKDRPDILDRIQGDKNELASVEESAEMKAAEDEDLEYAAAEDAEEDDDFDPDDD